MTDQPLALSDSTSQKGVPHSVAVDADLPVVWNGYAKRDYALPNIAGAYTRGKLRGAELVRTNNQGLRPAELWEEEVSTGLSPIKLNFAFSAGKLTSYFDSFIL